jgi:hypothetical protein
MTDENNEQREKVAAQRVVAQRVTVQRVAATISPTVNMAEAMLKMKRGHA